MVGGLAARRAALMTRGRPNELNLIGCLYYKLLPAV
jgi:hypothetical protein